MLGALWTQDDNQVVKFEKLASRSSDRLALRNSMTGDGPRNMEDYSG
jgi:hypothetical protein